MIRGLVVLLLLSAVLIGCSKSVDPHSKSIPNIPKGRSAVGPEAGQKLPVAPPKK
jgi:hypothetical protein